MLLIAFETAPLCFLLFHYSVFSFPAYASRSAFSAALVVACEKATPRKELVLDDMISDDDVALMHTNISEVLGAEHTEQ